MEKASLINRVMPCKHTRNRTNKANKMEVEVEVEDEIEHLGRRRSRCINIIASDILCSKAAFNTSMIYTGSKEKN
jgi:hypothetical protein